MHNHIFSVVNEAEAKLERTRLDHLSAMLSRGVWELTWQSHGVDIFIETASQALQSTYDIVLGMKRNVQNIRSIFAGWGQLPLFTRNLQRTYSPEDFQAFHTRNTEERYSIVRVGGVKIQVFITLTVLWKLTLFV